MQTWVRHGSVLEKQIEKGKIPLPILIKLQGWVHLVESRGIEEARKVPGYHDEPCVGFLKGYRSIRLNRGWRAYYRMGHDEGQSLVIRVIVVERVDKHEYGK